MLSEAVTTSLNSFSQHHVSLAQSEPSGTIDTILKSVVAAAVVDASAGSDEEPADSDGSMPAVTLLAESESDATAVDHTPHEGKGNAVAEGLEGNLELPGHNDIPAHARVAVKLHPSTVTFLKSLDDAIGETTSCGHRLLVPLER
jgi:hypothetical protein